MSTIMDKPVAAGSRLAAFLSRHALLISLAVLVVLAQVVSKGSFLGSNNLINVLAQNSVAGVLAVGQTMVILTSGIDLSLGSITALSSMVVLLMQSQGSLVARSSGLAVALACGLVNGVLVTKGRIPPFIATLGMMQVALGLAYVLGGGFAKYEEPHVPLLGSSDTIGPIPLIIVVWLVVAVLAWLIVKRTRYGSYIYATGGNERAARVSGVRTARVKIFVYVMAGLFAGVAGILYINRLGYSQPQIGGSLTLASIAPVVVGGTSLFGGIGGVWNTVAGVLIVGVLVNLMVLTGVNANIQQAVQGLLVLVVVSVFVRRQRRTR